MNTCTQCKKKVDYPLVSRSPAGVGPMVCVECRGFFDEESTPIESLFDVLPPAKELEPTIEHLYARVGHYVKRGGGEIFKEREE